MSAAWIIDQQWTSLNPPAEVRALGSLPRSPEKLLAASRVLRVKLSRRYQPTKVTWCNIYVSDVLDILDAPLPHWFDPDGEGPLPAFEERANMMADGLAAGDFPGWAPVGRMLEASTREQAVVNRAAAGLPTVAVWRNPKGTGHIVLVVPTPVGEHGIYVTGAGRVCVEQCPIAKAFGQYLPDVAFYGHP